MATTLHSRAPRRRRTDRAWYAVRRLGPLLALAALTWYVVQEQIWPGFEEARGLALSQASWEQMLAHAVLPLLGYGLITGCACLQEQIWPGFEEARGLALSQASWEQMMAHAVLPLLGYGLIAGCACLFLQALGRPLLSRAAGGLQHYLLRGLMLPPAFLAIYALAAAAIPGAPTLLSAWYAAVGLGIVLNVLFGLEVDLTQSK